MNVLFGIGNFLERNINILKQIMQIDYLSDNNLEKQEGVCHQIECIKPSMLKEMDCIVYITVQSTNLYQDIYCQLHNMGVKVGNLYENIIINNKLKKRMIIYGHIQDCREANIYLKNAVDVTAYATCYAEGIGSDIISGKEIISIFKAQEMLRNNDVDGIIAVASKWSFELVTRNTMDADILFSERFFVLPKRIQSAKLLDDTNQLTTYSMTTRLQNVQFMITRRCNLTADYVLILQH